MFFGMLKDMIGHAEESIEITPSSTIGAVFDSYAERFGTLRERRSSILFARNNEFSRPDTVLYENDEVAFLPPVSGGAEKPHNDTADFFFAITRDPIDSSALAERLKRPQDGAVVVFEGVVRNNTKGRETSYLEYDGYEDMALAQMTRIGKEIAEQYGIGRIGIVHRLGRLAIGEASVAVVATAPHRTPAFEAALVGIDRLKKEVPIWKKEFFADGAEWVEGEWEPSLLAGATRDDGL